MDRDPFVTYEHTQDSPRWVVALASLIVIGMFSVILALMRSDEISAWGALFVIVWLAFIYIVVINFTRLTTRLTPSAVALTWRLGWPTKVIERTRITATAARTNSWLAGWGIRKVSRGWMWNVWGLDAVELELDSGRIFRIGTNDVDELLAALQR